MQIYPFYSFFVIIAMLVVESDAKYCHLTTIGKWKDRNGTLVEALYETDVRSETGFCYYTYSEGEGGNATGQYIEESGIYFKDNDTKYTALAAEDGHSYGFSCETNLCNSKENPHYESARNLLEYVKKAGEKLKGNNTNLRCLDNFGKSLDCNGGFCRSYRNFIDEKLESSKLGCSPSGTKNMVRYLDKKKYAVSATVEFDGRKKIKTIDSYCSFDHCNKEENVKIEFEEIIANRSVYSDVLSSIVTFLVVLFI